MWIAGTETSEKASGGCVEKVLAQPVDDGRDARSSRMRRASMGGNPSPGPSPRLPGTMLDRIEVDKQLEPLRAAS